MFRRNFRVRVAVFRIQLQSTTIPFEKENKSPTATFEFTLALFCLSISDAKIADSPTDQSTTMSGQCQGPCGEPRSEDLALQSESNTQNISVVAHNYNAHLEDLNNYELEVEGDELHLENNKNAWITDEEYGDDEGEDASIECDLSSKRFTILSVSTAQASTSTTPSPYSSSPNYEPRPLPPLPIKKMPGPNVPKPGPAKLSKNAGLAEWLEEAKQCHYLPEFVMKQLCEIVKEHLMEGAPRSHLRGLFQTDKSSLQNPTFNPFVPPSRFVGIFMVNSTT
jgi:hypothetical protein